MLYTLQNDSLGSACRNDIGEFMEGLGNDLSIG